MLKILLNNEVHLYTGKKTLTHIKEFIQKSFKNPLQNYDIKYLNEKKDLIVVKTPQDIKNLEKKHNISQKAPRIFIRPRIQKEKRKSYPLLSIYKNQQEIDENDSFSDESDSFFDSFESEIESEESEESDCESIDLSLTSKQWGQKHETQTQQQPCYGLFLSNRVQAQPSSALFLDSRVAV